MFTRSFVAALLAAVAYAQSDANPFKIGMQGLAAAAGQPLNLEWDPTTEGTVSLILRSGSSNELAEGATIANGIDNSGSYTWNVPDSVTRGSDYTIEIVSDSDPSQTNYTPYFVLESDNTTPASTSVESLGAPSSSLALSTAPATVSPTSNTASATGSESATATESSESSMTMSGTPTTSRASSASPTGDAVTTGAASQTGAGARATAAAGLLGVVALGALAL